MLLLGTKGKEGNIINEEILLSFSGLETDDGIIDSKDLSRSIEGWTNFFNLTTSVFIQKDFSLLPLPIESKPQIKIKAMTHATFDLNTLVIIPLGLMIGYDFLKLLLKWQFSLIKKHIENKKSLITKEEAINIILLLAQKYKIEGKDDLDIISVIDTVDEALNNLLVPIDYSAKKLIISSAKTNQKVVLTSSDKKALKSGYHLDEGISSKGFELFKVKFIRINTETGKSIVVFNEPKDIDQIGHQYSEIIDPLIHEPRNVYTHALYENSDLEVWGRKIIDKRTNEFQRWIITKELPREDFPLFEDNNGR